MTASGAEPVPAPVPAPPDPTSEAFLEAARKGQEEARAVTDNAAGPAPAAAVLNPPPGPERQITKLVIGIVLTAAIVASAFALTGPRWGLFCMALGLYEGWTLVNRYREDTLSETLWEFAERPMIPCLFGIAYGWGAGSGYLGDPLTAGRNFAIGFLFGHFFFQRRGAAGTPF